MIQKCDDHILCSLIRAGTNVPGPHEVAVNITTTIWNLFYCLRFITFILPSQLLLKTEIETNIKHYQFEIMSPKSLTP